jgi:ATP:ADP antiporter, AAA family
VPVIPPANTAGLHSVLVRLVHIRREETAAGLLSFAYFFAVLSAYYIIRPVRDEMGVAVGRDGLERLFFAVFFVMVMAVPLFGWVVSTFPRRHIVTVVYGFFAVNLLMFWLLFSGEALHSIVAGTFFVWVSVFNLFIVSLFWIVMSDLWHSEQAKRLYGFIAAGGSTGALAGPAFTQSLVGMIGTRNLLLASALMLLGSIAAAMKLRRLFGETQDRQRAEDLPVGRGLLTGAVAVWRSPYLFRIALWILIANLVGTLFYLEQTRIVGETLADRAARVQLFARIDLAVGVLTILAQLLLTAGVMERLGIGIAAALLPASAVLGLIGLAVSPTLGVIVAVMAMERAVAFAFANPAVKVLYTVVAPEEKYKAQNFNDTVVFRAGDAASGWVFTTLARSLGLGLGGTVTLTLPVALAWLGLSLALGRQHAGRAGPAATSPHSRS